MTSQQGNTATGFVLSLTATMASLLERMNISTDSIGPVRAKVNASRSSSVPYVRSIP
jgi:hypothetical protein